MRIRWEPKGVDVSGTLSELANVASEIDGVASSAKAFVEVVGETDGSPAPYDRLLACMRVTSGNGPVRISEHPQGVLHVTGGSQELAALESYFLFGPDATRGAHNHYEYFPGNEYVTADSLPLVVSVTVEGNREKGRRTSGCS